MRFYQASAVLLIASLAGRFIDNERSRDTYCRLLHSATLHMIVRGVVALISVSAGVPLGAIFLDTLVAFLKPANMILT